MGEIKGEIRGIKEIHKTELDAVTHVYETALEDNAHLGQKNEALEQAVTRIGTDNRKGATLLMKQALGHLRFRDLLSTVLTWRDGVEKAQRTRLESKMHESTLAAQLQQEAFEVKEAEMRSQLKEQASAAAADIKAMEESQAAAEKVAADSREEVVKQAAEENEALRSKAEQAQAAWDADMQHTVKEYETAVSSLQRKLRSEKHRASAKLLRHFVGHLQHVDVVKALRDWRNLAYQCQIDTAANRFETLVEETEHKLEAAQKETNAKLADAEKLAEERVSLAERAADERVSAVQKDAEATIVEAEKAAEEVRRQAADDQETMKHRMEASKKAQADEVCSGR